MSAETSEANTKYQQFRDLLLKYQVPPEDTRVLSTDSSGTHVMVYYRTQKRWSFYLVTDLTAPSKTHNVLDANFHADTLLDTPPNVDDIIKGLSHVGGNKWGRLPAGTLYEILQVLPGGVGWAANGGADGGVPWLSVNAPGLVYLPIGNTGQFMHVSSAAQPEWHSFTNLDMPTGTMFDISQNDQQASITVPNTDTNIKTYSLGINAYSLILTMGDGYIQTTNLSTLQDINLKVLYGGFQVGQILIYRSESALAGKAPFHISAQKTQGTATTVSISAGAANADANTTVFLNNLRVFGRV